MAWYARIANVFRTQRLSDVLDEELRFHIAERIDDLVAEGMSRSEAYAAATRAFGSYTVQKTRTRDVNIATRFEAILKDLQYAARQLRLAPIFAIVAVLSLALGIGANSAMFQLINAIGLRTLPVPEPQQLASIGGGPDFSTSGWSSGRHRVFTFAQLEQIGASQDAFESLMAFGTTNFNLSRGGEARFANGLWITPNFLEVLGVVPHVGAWLAADTAPRECAGAGAFSTTTSGSVNTAATSASSGATSASTGGPFRFLLSRRRRSTASSPASGSTSRFRSAPTASLPKTAAAGWRT